MKDRYCYWSVVDGDYSVMAQAVVKSARQVGVFKDLTGVSRKYAIPLLEWLDRERVTRREGDARVIL